MSSSPATASHFAHGVLLAYNAFHCFGVGAQQPVQVFVIGYGVIALYDLSAQSVGFLLVPVVVYYGVVAEKHYIGKDSYH